MTRRFYDAKLVTALIDQEAHREFFLELVPDSQARLVSKSMDNGNLSTNSHIPHFTLAKRL